MSLASATISMNLKDLVGDTFDGRRTKVWASTNIPTDTVIDTAGNEIRLGTGSSTVDEFGNATLTVLVPGVGSNPASWQTYVHVDYPDKARQERAQRTFGPFTITGNVNLADLILEQEIPPEYTGALLAEMTALRDQQVELSGVDNTATAVSYVIQNDAAVKAGLSASIEVGVESAVPVIAPDVTADQLGRPAAALAADFPGVYTPRLNTFNIKAKHFRRTEAALGRAEDGTGKAHVISVGSSIAAGHGFLGRGFPAVLRDLFVADGAALSGTGIVPVHHADSLTDPRWTLGGPWSVFVINGFKTMLLQGGNGSTATFRSDRPGRTVNLHYSGLGPAFTVAIDGAAPVTVTPNGSSVPNVYTVGGLADTRHTVVVTLSGGTYLIGCEVTRAAGLAVSNLGLGGAKASDIVASSVPYGALGFAVAQNPDLITVNVMTNDTAQGVSAASYKASLETIIQTVQAAGIDLLLIAEIPAQGQDFTAHRRALYELADTYDVAVLDMFDRWNSYTEANARGLMSDAFHPTPAGYKDYGRAIRASIRPGGGKPVTGAAQVPQQWVNGYYYCPPGTTAAGALANGTLSLSPIYIPHDITLDRLGIEITAAATPGGAKIALCWYEDDQGWPGRLISFAGFAAADSTGVKEATGLNAAIKGGTWLWFGGLVLDATGGNPTVRTITASHRPGMPGSSLANALSADAVGAQQTGLSTLPATFGGSRGTPSPSAIKVALRPS